MIEKRVVPGYEWLTVDRNGNCLNTRFNRPFKGEIDKYGYKRVNTRYKGKCVRCLVHRAVALAFIPNPDNLPTVNHINAIKDDNRVENLEWATHQDQANHVFKMKLKLDTRVYGEDTTNSKYTEQKIREVCTLLEQGYRDCDIEKICDVNRQLPRDIRNKKSWKTISKEYDINFKRNQRVSEATVKWVCKKLEDGWSTERIYNDTTSTSLSRTLIKQIRVRNTFTYISKNYDF